MAYAEDLVNKIKMEDLFDQIDNIIKRIIEKLNNINRFYNEQK